MMKFELFGLMSEFFFWKDFMTAVSLQCKIWNHHPEWSNVSILHILQVIH